LTHRGSDILVNTIVPGKSKGVKIASGLVNAISIKELVAKGTFATNEGEAT